MSAKPPAASGPGAPPQSGEPGRYDAFLSYAREDDAFAKRLVRELAAKEQRVWLDVQDIPGGADWRHHQARALEACKAFVFVLSPDSLRSEHCRRELEQAQAHAKLVIPVYHRKVDERDLPTALADPEWIFLRKADRFEEGVDKLVEALHVDHDWREQHTRLATRSREWEDSQRDKSFLLAGADLAEAESWFAKQSGHLQTPTALQAEFIIGSRRASVGRQRRLTLILITAFLFTVVLVGYALLQRNYALDQKNSVQSRAMAAQARELARTNIDAGALLALEAYRLKPTLEARSSVLAVVPSLQRAYPVFARQLLRPLELSTNREDGIIVLSERGGRIREIDPVRGRILSEETMPRWKRYVPVPSPNGELLAYGGSVADLWVWDRTRQKMVARLYDGPIGTPVYKTLFNRDNRTIAVLHATGVRLWNVKSDRVLNLTPPLNQMPYMSRAMAISQNGRLIAAGTVDGCVYVWRVAGGDLIQPGLCGKSMTTSLSFSHSGTRLAVGERKGVVRVWQLDQPSRKSTMARIHRGAVVAIAFDRDDKTIASAGEDGALSAWDSRTRRLSKALIERNSSVSSLVGQRAFDDVTFDASGETLVALSEGVGRAWDASRKSAFGVQVADGGSPRSARHDYGNAVSPDGHLVAVRSSVAGPAVIWNRRNGKRVALAHVEGVGPLEFSRDGRAIVAQGHDYVALWNAASGELDREIEHAPAVMTSGQSAALSPDGKLIVTTKDFPKDEAENFGVQVWKVSDGSLVRSLPSPFHYETSDVAFSPDGKLLAATGIGEPSKGTIQLWDTSSWTPVARRLIDRSQEFSGLAFSPDGEILATARRPGPVQLWSARHLEPLGKPILADVDVVPALAFSPDGQTLATGGEDGRIRLWDVATQELLGRPINAHPRHVDTLRFSSDGNELISVGDEGAVRVWGSILWSSNLAQLQAFICGATGRDLSPSEWRQLVPEETYRPTCSL